MSRRVLSVRREGADDTVERRLRDAGFAVETATTTAEARETVLGSDFGCVVSRYEVPRADGLEFGGGLRVLDRIRDVDEDVPFILVTDIVNQDVVREAIGRDIYDYVRQSDERSLDRLVRQVRVASGNYRTRERVRQLSRVNELIRDLNSQLVRASSTDGVFDAVCAELTRLDAYAFAWVGTRDGGPQRHSVAGCPADEDPDRLARPVLATLGDRTLTRTAVPSADAAGDDDPWAPARAAGYASALAVRIRHEDHAYATLVLYADRTDAFDETECEVIRELGDTVGYALKTIETRQALEARERELRRQNDRLENFASMVSHDLRNPLQTARGRAELLDDADHGETLITALDRMETIIDNILALTREDDIAVDPTGVHLASCARDAWATVTTAGASLAVETDATVVADRGYLEQIFENLFRNAVDHGGPDVTVRVTDHPDGFAVADDGRGFGEADPDRVFEMGVTGNDAGSGFGLAIVEEIADAHGWTVAATESEDGGARFVFDGVEFAD
ncbi:MAG: ATP-binding protein [Haloarculaceae archaeon]